MERKKFFQFVLYILGNEKREDEEKREKISVCDVHDQWKDKVARVQYTGC